MPLRPLLPLLFAGVLLGCKHDADTAAPTPPCYSGVVLGQSCNDGTLIEVDGRYLIGQSVAPHSGYLSEVPASDSIGSNNVIAAINSLPPLFRKGQRVYFTYQNDPQKQLPPRQRAVFGPLAIPHFVLGNISAVPCTP